MLKKLEYADGGYMIYHVNENHEIHGECKFYHKDSSFILTQYYINGIYVSLHDYKTYLVKERLNQNSPQDEVN